MNIRALHFGFGALLIMGIAASSKADQSFYWGEARGKDGRLAYRERHTVTFMGERVMHSLTEYLSPDGTFIAAMESDYSRNDRMPTYVFEDSIRGLREGLRLEGDEYVIFRQRPGKDEETRALRETDNVFSCQGWHYFLVENLSLLDQGNLALDLILPSELKAYTFRVEKTGQKDGFVSAVIKINNRLLRLFAPKLHLVYDTQHRKLVEYRGVSNIAGADGKRQDVTITYIYE